MDLSKKADVGGTADTSPFLTEDEKDTWQPGIRPQICIDLYILRFVSAWVQKWFGLNTDLPSLVDEYGARLVDELDFTLEAQRAESFCRAADKLVPDGAVTAARPVLELTTSSVLVTEWVCGERLELTAARDLEEAQRLQAVAMTSYLAMLLETGSLHADPHWGNLLRREGLRRSGGFMAGDDVMISYVLCMELPLKKLKDPGDPRFQVN
eukprot:s590_g42.t1